MPGGVGTQRAFLLEMLLPSVYLQQVRGLREDPPEAGRRLLRRRLEPIKKEAKVISHSRRTVFHMAEVAVPGALFAGVLPVSGPRPSLPPEAAETKGQAPIKHASGGRASSNTAESEVIHATVGKSIMGKGGESRLWMREFCINLSCGMVGY